MGYGRRGRRTREMEQIALERIKILIREAAAAYKSGSGYHKRYVQLARKIGERYNVRIPTMPLPAFCKGCDSPLIPGHSVRARIRGGSVVYTCLVCNNRIVKK